MGRVGCKQLRRHVPIRECSYIALYMGIVDRGYYGYEETLA